MIAQELTLQPEQSGATLYKFSVGALAAATTFDLATSIADSHGCGQVTCYETNPLFTNSKGQFSTPRAIAFKSAFDGGMIVAEMLLLKKYPRLRRTLSILNFGEAGAYTYAGVHNLSLRH